MKALIFNIFLAMSCAPMTVQVCNSDGMCGTGYVDGDHIVTAAHNVGHGLAVQYSTRAPLGPARVPANVVELIEYKDMAVLKTGYDIHRSLRYCQPRVGDEVIVYVQAATSIRCKHTARVTSVEGWYAYLDYRAQYGDSGAPVVRSEGRCVIGIVVANTDRGTCVSIGRKGS